MPRVDLVINAGHFGFRLLHSPDIDVRHVGGDEHASGWKAVAFWADTDHVDLCRRDIFECENSEWAGGRDAANAVLIDQDDQSI